MYNCNLDDAVKNIKTIVENNRCFFCDHLNVSFVRYPCGHLTCNNCVETAEDCLLCLTPPDASAHFVDEPASQRVRNASELLNAFQDLFEIDVFRRHRVSEKLKLEKQLFPECIQASTKYCNKRKSHNTTEKENKRFLSLPGEKISLNKLPKMENTVNYVENWLNKNESDQTSPLKNKNLPRKPFTDLNVNQTNNKDANNLSFQSGHKKSLGSKRTHLKLIKGDASNLAKVSYKQVKNNKNSKEHKIQEANKKYKNKKCENNESGIYIDDEIIDIQDSQCEVIDKDQLAQLAVLQAHKNDNSIDCGIDSMNENEINTSDNVDEPNKSQDVPKTNRVPFLKRSSFVNVCNVKTDNLKNITKTTQSSKNITVTIDNDSFVTTIKVTNSVEGFKSTSKQSTAAQTDNDIANTAIPSNKIELNKTNKLINVIHEDNILMEVKSSEVEPNNFNSGIGKKRKCLIIEESDSDSDLTDGNINSLEVTAEVHQSDIGDGVLCELEQNVYEHRAKHAVRELTPLSTDSSDKENYDPNRIKKQKLQKKNYNKK